MQAGDVVGGRYRLDRELGRGGFGVVWAAHDETIGRAVALKVLSDEKAGDEEAVGRFIREARTVGLLSNPHIVTLYDYGRVQDGARSTHYLVMELVRGRSLAQVMRDGLPEPAVSLRWVRQICKALDAAHRNGVVHRDIKPENIMITDGGEAKVLDFGIARLLSQPAAGGLTSTDVVIGTPVYLAPECWAGLPIDGRADLYALGVVLYQLCTGRRPFNADQAVTMMYAHLNEQPLPPDTADPALDRLILQLLAKKAADRPADAAEVRQRLRDLKALRERKGGTDPEALRQKADDAWRRGAAGSPERAAEQLVGLIPQFARAFGPADPRTLRTCHDLALWLARSGRPRAAVALLRELLPALDGHPRAREDVGRDLERWERDSADAAPDPARPLVLAELLDGTAQSG
ncbi:serine/threonine protein kinase [Kitasatospora purpeofusca]|uniref:serine/threonine-protein kinase n=1 Tax=Kitasatospora purpeofusca TaxID=67352 RepID=UPI002250C4E1|nr:serine/threonine-protein kinase [Kitasatospora purpeofusca]MCX4687723.1 serine/threonine protein kinase [Kitasatospora purpeofusca]